VIGRLNESDADGGAIGLAPQHGLHQRPTDAVILRRRVHGHRADPGDNAALIDERASQDLACPFRDESGKTVVGEHAADHEAREIARAGLDREAVPSRD
jgi:hypothetical protein